MPKKTNESSGFFAHPVWLAGFRPFFPLSILAGIFLPWLWILSYSFGIDIQNLSMPTQHWHAHEMLFGFGGAVLAGFLLTASKNWVKTRGMHGKFLALACLLWLLERLLIPHLPANTIPGIIVINIFPIYVFGYIIKDLIVHRKQDSFKDNYFFVFALPIFMMSKNLVTDPDFFNTGVALAISVYRLIFVIMLERTLGHFMNKGLGIKIPKNVYLDWTIKHLMFAAIFAPFMPDNTGAWLLSAVALLMFVRFLSWKPHLAFRKFATGLSFAGYLGLTIHLAIEAMELHGTSTGIGSLSIHVFSFLCMGFVIPAMFIRICQGHTGRSIAFTISDRIAMAFMACAAYFRLVSTQLYPEDYMLFIIMAGIFWSLCFAIIGFRLIPFTLQKRIDGKVH